MKNTIFISPNFPTNYWQFCRELRDDGMNVLGIGDQPFEELSWELKDCLTEYYRVDTLEDYEAVYRGVAFFIHKYGRIHWLESNNEYWLERDARLRTDFHITSGFQLEDIPRIKYKSKMKEYYAKAGIPAARWHLVEGKEDCLAFIQEVGYPVVVKPDNGVGASDTHKLSTPRSTPMTPSLTPTGSRSSRQGTSPPCPLWISSMMRTTPSTISSKSSRRTPGERAGRR